MIRSEDQLGIIHEFSQAPRRIVSIVPSQTELLYDLGLTSEVVGITKFCIHPEEWFRTKTRVGGTKNVNIEKVRELNPDLIIGNKEENTLNDIQELREIAPVWMSDIYSLQDALEMIKSLGSLCLRGNEGLLLANRIEQNFDQLTPVEEHKRILYFIWKDPYMAAAKNTFIDHILTEHLGLVNALVDEERYPSVELSQIEAPELIFLSSEPYPFNESHIEGLTKRFPNSKVILVDGEYFTWYGSRLEGAPKYFAELLQSLKLH